MSPRPDDSGKVSYRDVAELARSVGREYGGDVECQLVFDVGPAGNVHFHVRAAYRPRSVGVRTVRANRTVSSPWPTGRAATVAGLMFNLVYDLERQLESAECAPVESEQARLWRD